MGFLPGRKSQQASAAVQSGRKQLPRPTNYIHSMDFISIHHTPPPAPKGTSVTEFQHLMTGKTDRTRIAEESCFCGFAILLLQLQYNWPCIVTLHTLVQDVVAANCSRNGQGPSAGARPSEMVIVTHHSAHHCGWAKSSLCNQKLCYSTWKLVPNDVWDYRFWRFIHYSASRASKQAQHTKAPTCTFHHGFASCPSQTPSIMAGESPGELAARLRQRSHGKRS